MVAIFSLQFRGELDEMHITFELLLEIGAIPNYMFIQTEQSQKG